jgi:hypothetical protein
MLLSICLDAFSSPLKMEMTCYSETATDFQWTTQCCIAEDGNLHYFEDLPVKLVNLSHLGTGDFK